MAWQTPKIDWKSSDFYNIEDWHRVRNNLEHIWTWITNKHRAPTKMLRKTDNGRMLNEIPYVDLVNNMEFNLGYLQEIFGTVFLEDTHQTTWYARLDAMYNSNPTYQDWTRWEVILKRVQESIDYIDTYAFAAVSGAFYSGNGRTLMRFSRGR